MMTKDGMVLQIYDRYLLLTVAGAVHSCSGQPSLSRPHVDTPPPMSLWPTPSPSTEYITSSPLAEHHTDAIYSSNQMFMEYTACSYFTRLLEI